MQTVKFENREEWLFARRGKITGTRLKDLWSPRGTDKIGFYELIAERLGVPPDDSETPMERGSRLEGDAIDRFSAETGKIVDKSMVIWQRDENENIAISPDGIVLDELAAVEAKCLSSARHIEAYVKRFIDGATDWDAVPDEYRHQAIQYFVTNDALETLYFVFFDPRFAMFTPNGEMRMEGKSNIDFFYLTLSRPHEEVEKYLPFEQKTIERVNEIVNKLTF